MKKRLLMLILVSMLMFTGCGSESTIAPDETVELYLTALQETDFDVADEYLQDGLQSVELISRIFFESSKLDSELKLQLAQAFTKDIEFREVKLIEENEDSAIVTATVRNVRGDMILSDYRNWAFSGGSELYMSDDEEIFIEQSVALLIYSCDLASHIDKDVTFYLTKAGDVWLIDGEYDTFNGVLGGLYVAAQEYAEKYN